jgi:hypothetical protein
MPSGGASYEIRIKGRLSDSLLAAFEGLTATAVMVRSRTSPRCIACWTASVAGPGIGRDPAAPPSPDEPAAEPSRRDALWTSGESGQAGVYRPSRALL